MLTEKEIQQRRDAARARWSKERVAGVATAGVAAGVATERGVTALLRGMNERNLRRKQERRLNRLEARWVGDAEAKAEARRTRVAEGLAAAEKEVAGDPKPSILRYHRLRRDAYLRAARATEDAQGFGIRAFASVRRPGTSASEKMTPREARMGAASHAASITRIEDSEFPGPVKVPGYEQQRGVRRRTVRERNAGVKIETRPVQVSKYKRRQLRGRISEAEVREMKRDMRAHLAERATVLNQRTAAYHADLNTSAVQRVMARDALDQRLRARLRARIPSGKSRLALLMLGGSVGAGAAALATRKKVEKLAKNAPPEKGGEAGIAAGLAKAFASLREYAASVIDRMRWPTSDLFDENRYQEMLKSALDPLGRPFMRAAKDAGTPDGEDKILAVSFDLIEPRVFVHLDEYRMGLIRQITEGQKETIRRIVTTLMAQGLPPSAMAKHIRDVVGLTPHQATNVSNYRSELEAVGSFPREGVNPQNSLNRALRDARFDRTVKRAIAENRPLAPEQIDKMVEAYQRRYIALRATTIARTESLRAANLGAVMGARETAEFYGLEVEKTWLATKDDRTRDAHRELDGKTVSGIDVPFMLTDGRTIKFPHDPDAPGDLTINCLLPGAKVFAPGLRAVTSRLYEGDAITFQAANGAELSCTINHPVLTRRGWVAAQFLQEGDSVICAPGSKWSDLVDNDQHAPPRVEDIENTLDLLGAAGLQVIRRVDFHREGVESQVRVVEPDLELLSKLVPALRHPGAKLVFLGAGLMPKALASFGGSDAAVVAARLAADGIMGGLDLSLASLIVHLAPFESLGLTACPGSASVFVEDALHDVASNAVLIREALDRLTGVESRKESGEIWRRPDTTSQPGLATASGGGLGADVDLPLVEEIRIVAIRRHAWRGHVYNLETDSQIYVANGFVQHNCRCTLQTSLVRRQARIINLRAEAVAEESMA